MAKPTYTSPVLNTSWAHYSAIHAACPFMNDTAVDISGNSSRTITLNNTNGGLEWHTSAEGRGIRKTSNLSDTLQYQNLLPVNRPGTLILIYNVNSDAPSSTFFGATTYFSMARFSSNTQMRLLLNNQVANGVTGSGDYLKTTGGAAKALVMTWDDTSRAAFFTGFDTEPDGTLNDAYNGAGAAAGLGAHGTTVTLLSAADGGTATTGITLLGVVSLNTRITDAQARAIVNDPWAWVEESAPPGNQSPVFSGTVSTVSGTVGAAITPVDVSGLFSDPDFDTLTYSQSGTWPARAGGGSWVNATTGVISGTPDTGANTGSPYTGLTVSASDGDLSASSNTFQFIVNAASGTAPTITAVSGNAVHGQGLTITGTNLTGAAVTLSYGTVTVAQTESASADSVTIAAVDSVSLPYKSVTLSVTTANGTATTSIPHVPPEGKSYIVVDVPWDVTADSIFEGSPDTAAVDGDQIEYDKVSDRGVNVIVREDGTVRVSDSLFPHKFYVRVWDESTLTWGSQTLITVTPSDYTGGAPIWAGPNIPNQNFVAGDSVTLEGARFEDPENDITGYSLVGTWPFWATINATTGQITGTAVIGAWPGLSIRATDSFGSVGESNVFSITVVGPPSPPIWSGPAYGTVSYEAGNAVSLNMGQFTDVDSSIVSYSVTGTLPIWASFDTATGVISGTATPGVWAGITVTAIDSTGLTGNSPTIAIAVSDAPVDPPDPGVVVSTGRGKTLISLVNSVLRRLREETVTSLASDYACLIAEFVSDTHKEVVEACDWTSMDHDVVVLVKAGKTDYVLYEGSEDITEDSIPPNSRSILRYSNDAPVAYLYASEDDMDEGAPLNGMDEANEQIARLDLWARNQTTGRPYEFAVFTDRIENGVVLKLGCVPDADYWLKIRWHTPEEEINCETDEERMIYAPSKPLILGAVFLALNERGEELGEPGALAERRYRSALAAEVETDRMRQIKTNMFEMYRE